MRPSRSVAFPAVVWPLVLATLLVACGDGGTANVPPADTGAADTATDLGPSDLGPMDSALDVAPADLGTPDTAPSDTGTDAVDAQDVPRVCTTNADCAGDPRGGACHVPSGACVQCVASADTCPASQHCDDASHTCVAGCRSDEGCSGGDAGVPDAGAGLTRCDTATHACVACVTDAHCAAGQLCVGSVCVAGCNPSRPCPTGQTCCSGACVDPLTSTAHCGACDARCAVPNGLAACMNGACAVGACTAPFADCNARATDGCEVNTLTDTAHCGRCGGACAARAHASASCAAGTCAWSCDTGWADCDGEASNGCETDTTADAAHCGACRAACDLANATPTCTAGRCAVGTCREGYGDCDGNAANGCETDTRTAVSHCGRCANACPSRAHAVPACTAGACAAVCVAGYGECNGDPADGCETDTTATAAHCGSCGRVCSFPRAGALCTAGACALGACEAGYGDCDGDAANGCETDTGLTAAHCGRCGNACPSRAHATPTCAAGACGFACETGYGDCDGNPENGCETALDANPTHCGRCGNACSSGVCRAGACAAPACPDGVRNGTETGLDCGGPGCPTCALCETCGVNSDCATSQCLSGRCGRRAEVTVDWLANCVGAGGGGRIVTVPGLPAGRYRVTALSSAGTVWSPVSYPSTGWFWQITCSNLAVPALATPSGTLYPTPEAAFAALPRTTSDVDFAGGTLSCNFNDAPCSDNQGGVRFSVDYLCP